MKKLFFIVLIILLFISPLQANSALKNWEGSDSYGVIATDEDCPLIIQHEDLFFNLQQLPKSYYDNSEEFAKLESKVTASYTFSNPADYDVQATLYFPIGTAPFYAPHLSFEPSASHINVDGKAVEKQLRCYYSPHEFNTEDALKHLQDAYSASLPLQADQVLTRLVLQLENPESGTYVRFHLPADRYVICNSIAAGTVEDDWYEFTVDFQHNPEGITVYLVGEDNYLTDYIFYENRQDQQESENQLKIISSDALTLRELINSTGVLAEVQEQDRINCFIDCMMAMKEGGALALPAEYNISSNAIFGYTYQISVKSGQSINNTVEVPMYPSINGYYDPPIYTYNYLSSPARSWKAFNDLDIYVKTPHVLSKSSVGEMSMTDEVYHIHLDGLPQQEISFQLCESTSPKRETNGYTMLLILMLVGAIILFAIFITLMVALIRFIKKKHRNHK